MNIHVVRAIAKALIETNPSSSQHIQSFSMPRSWVQSLYQKRFSRKAHEKDLCGTYTVYQQVSLNMCAVKTS